MQTALQKLKAYWAAANYRAALKLAAKWPRLGEHRDAIQKGWAAASRPDFYRELGQDPDALEAAGVAAVADRYNLGGEAK